MRLRIQAPTRRSLWRTRGFSARLCAPDPASTLEASLETLELALLAAAGLVAGVINTLAGGGSLLTVPVLVLLGLPGTLANGTNRVGILAQNLAAAWRFRVEGVSGLREAVPFLVPLLLGSVLGATAVSRFSDDLFERAFGLVMLFLLVPTLWPPKPNAVSEGGPRSRWPGWLRFSVFLGIGLYGGSFQAGVGIILVLALARSGLDLVHANSIKVVVMAAFTAAALPVFALSGQISWPAALALTVGFAIGGGLGARLAVVGGERLIRPVLAIAVVALAGRMLSLY